MNAARLIECRGRVQALLTFDLDGNGEEYFICVCPLLPSRCSCAPSAAACSMASCAMPIRATSPAAFQSLLPTLVCVLDSTHHR